MGRHEHYEDRSGDSAFLEAFRKRKNERLRSELDLDEETDAPIAKQGESSFRAPSDSSGRKSDNRQPTHDISLRVSEHISDATRLSGDTYYPPLPFKSEKTEHCSFDSMDDGFTDFSELSGVSLPSEDHHSMMNSETTERSLTDDSDHRTADVPDEDPFKMMPSDSADYSAVSHLALEEERDSANSMTSSPSKKKESHTGSRTEKPKSGKPRSTSEVSSSSSKKNNAASEMVKGGGKKNKGNHGILFFFIFLVAVVTILLLIKSRVNKNTSNDNRFDASSSAISDEYLYDVYSTESDNLSDENTSEEMSSDLSSVGSEAEMTSDVESTESTAPFVFRKLFKGSEGEEVKIMQQRLAELGYMSAQSCTGFYGDFTVKRVKAFQKKAGLKVTGEADIKTLERLFAADAPLCD